MVQKPIEKAKVLKKSDDFQAGEISVNPNAMSVQQVVSYMATKPNVKMELDMLISRGMIKNVSATKKELKRLGHYVG